MAVDSSFVLYTAVATPYIPITPGQTLQTILQNIDTAINTHNTAPDYTHYNLGPYSGYSITQTDGTSHPTNTQNFAEGISKIVCQFEAAYNTFTTSTYTAAISTLTSAVTGLQLPAITYSPFSITNTDTITQVLNKNFTGIGTILTAINPNAANWSTLSISTQTTITGGFNALIAYLSSLTTTVSGKQAAIATIDNSANVLTGSGGTSTDTVRTTATLLTTYVTTLPSYAAGSITTWGGITTGTTLQNSIQYIVNAVNGLFTNGVVAAGTGLTLASVGTTYQGKKLAIDTTYTTLYKTMVDSSDTTPDFLNAKITAGTGISTSIQNVAGDENIQITNTLPETYKVLISATDSSHDYLANKLPSTNDSVWGLALNNTQVNNALQLVPTIGNPYLFIQSLITYIGSDTTLLTQFQDLVVQAAGSPGAAITNLSVALSTSSFVLTWTHQSGTSQIAKWRQYGTNNWFTQGFSVANPMSGTAATNTLTVAPINVVTDHQVDTVYSTGTVGSNIYQMVYYATQTLSSSVNAGIITVNQSPLPFDSIQYRLRNSVPTVIQNGSTTGAQPNFSFTSVASGTYTVQWRYGTLVNGSTLYSDDASQVGSWFTSGSIVVP